MNTELQMLGWTVVLGLIHLVAATTLSVGKLGLGYAFSARDEGRAVSGKMGRLERSFRNFIETLPFFIAAVVLVQALNRHTPMAALGAQLYFWARVVYIPLYLSGVPIARTLCWFASVIGIALVLAAAIM